MCPPLRLVKGSPCTRGHCDSGSVRYLSTLGTTCVITCTGNHDNRPPTLTAGRKYNFTCVWENDVNDGGKAVWKPEYLPDGIMKGDAKYLGLL